MPILGSYIDKAHVEPLHLKHNAWQYFFKAVLREAIRKSKLPTDCKKFSEVPADSPFARVITAFQTEVNPGASQTRPNNGLMKLKGLELICIIDLLEKIPAVFVTTS